MSFWYVFLNALQLYSSLFNMLWIRECGDEVHIYKGNNGVQMVCGSLTYDMEYIYIEKLGTIYQEIYEVFNSRMI